MDKFEYRILEYKSKSIWRFIIDVDKIQEESNRLGNEGWELVSSSIYAPQCFALMFKRKK